MFPQKPEITPEEIIAIRRSLGLTQAEAGKLLGGGPSAYAKYEAGTVKPAAAAINLLRLLKTHPTMLATLRDTELSAIAPIASVISLFEVNSKHIKDLPRENLPTLLRRLLTAEAENYNLPAPYIHVPDDTDTPDGGEDGRITWEDGRGKTRSLPSRRCQFQLKGGPVQPAQAGHEVLTKDGTIKGMVREFLEVGGHYIMLCTRSYPQQAIEKRVERIQAKLHEAGLHIARDRILFRDANQIAGWINCYPPIAKWVLEKTESGIPDLFQTWSQWDKHAAPPWTEDARLPEFRARLLEQAARPRSITRVVGPYGIGKSRLTLQALAPIGAGRSISDLVLYADEFEAGPYAISAVIQKLAEMGTHTTAVVNHCSPERHRTLENMALHLDSRLSLITIDTETSGTSSSALELIQVLPPATTVVEAIIDRVSPELPREDRRRLVQFSARTPGIAVLVANAWNKRRPLTQAADGSLVDTVVLGRYPHESGLLRETAKLLAIFGKVESGSRNGGELDTLAQLGRNLTSDDLHAAMENLINRGVVHRHGKLMHFPFSPVAAWLAERQWREWTRAKWDAILEGSVGPGLSLQAIQRLALLNNTNTAQKVVVHACQADGPLDKALRKSSASWAAMLTPLAEIDAASVVKLLDRTLEQNEGELNVRDSTEIVRALSRIAFRSDTFESGARLLLRLAARNEQEMNSAVHQFISLFPVYLGNTVASGEERLQFLDEATDNNRPEEQPVIVEALTAGLTTHSFSRGVGDEIHGSRPALEPWSPDTNQEIREYISGCADRIVQFAERSDEIGNAARANLGKRLHGLVSIGLINTVEQAVARIRNVADCWPEAIDGLGQFISHDAPEKNQALIRRVRKLIDLLQPQGLESRGRFLVTNLPWDYPSDRKLTHEEQYQFQVKEVKELAAEFIKQPGKLKQLLPEMSRGRQRMALEFGRALAGIADTPLNWLEPIASAVADAKGKEQNFDLLCGYLSGINKRYPDAVCNFKRRAAQSPELAPVLPMICQHCGIDPSDIRLTLDALEAGRLPPDRLRPLAYSKEFVEVPAAETIPLFDWLHDHNAEAFRVEVHLLEPYVCEKPKNLNNCRLQVRRLAKDAIRHETPTNGGLLDCRYEQIMRKVLEKGWQDPDARAVALNLAKALASIGEWYQGKLIKPLLPLLLSKFTEIVWPVLGQVITSDLASGERFKHILGCRHSFDSIKCPLILKLPEEALFEWCHERPDRAPAFVAGALPVLTTYRPDAPDRTLHPVLYRLLDEFSDQGDVFREINRSIRMYCWSGWPLARYYELFLGPLEQLRDKHQKKLVRLWAKHMLPFLLKQIDAAQRKDEEREAQRDL